MHVVRRTFRAPHPLSSYGRFTSKCAIIPAAWCSRMWQWYIHMPGLSSGYHAIRTVAFGGTLITSSSDRQAGFFPSISRTWKKKPCRWNG